MEGQSQGSRGHEETLPVRSRWSPTQEQIMILESIFNSGMVNPSKDETAGIRKLIQKFGPVGDANVFYWFQNRRSRSRRRLRQIEATLSDNSTSTGVTVGPNPVTPGSIAPTSGGLLQFSGHASFSGASASSSSHSGLITVFINGVATTVVERLNLKWMFGGDYRLVHSSGVEVEVNHHGFVINNLQHGENYFLVPRNA